MIEKSKINLALTLLAYISVFITIFATGILFQKHVLNPQQPEENKTFASTEVITGFTPTSGLMLYHPKTKTLSIYPKEVCEFIYAQYDALNYYRSRNK